jgi:hypothetical protein
MVICKSLYFIYFILNLIIWFCLRQLFSGNIISTLFLLVRPFNLKGDLWFFVSFRIFFSDITRVRIFFFFVANKVFQNVISTSAPSSTFGCQLEILFPLVSAHRVTRGGDKSTQYVCNLEKKHYLENKLKINRKSWIQSGNSSKYVYKWHNIYS